MQTIIHSYKHELKTLRQVEYVYHLMSDYDRETKNKSVPNIFFPLIDEFTANVYITKPKFYKDTYETISVPTDKKFMLVCCSGGKDSVAVATKLKNCGKEVMLYHMKGINRAYFDEHKAVETIARILDVPYYIEDVRLTGKHMYVEHPMKNMLIANGAIQFCLDHNLPVNISFGNYMSSWLEDMDFEIDAGDSRDMWDIYEGIIQHEIPDFLVHTPLNDISETYDIILKDYSLLENTISCMSPYRFRKYWKERTETKYGVELLPNRCGCCAKCCLEYMVLADKGIIEYNPEYYIHCFGILGKTALKETRNSEATVDQIWNRYFWYDISQSHLKYEI